MTFLPPEDLHGVEKVIIELHPSHYGMQGVQRIKDRFAKNDQSVEQQQDDPLSLQAPTK